MADNRRSQEALDEAVEQFIRDTGWNKSGTLTAWVLVGHQISFDEDGDSIDTYPIVFKGGSQPDHIVLGLLKVYEAQMQVEMYRHSRRLDDDE